jgi:threonine/homoserine/homoserine lactone efflux protein
MGAVIGDLLPLALGIAISAGPISEVILMLLTPRAGAAGVGFSVGRMLGIAVVTTIVLAITNGADLGGSSSEPSRAESWITLLLGVLLLGVGAFEWRERPKSDAPAAQPKWMAAFEKLTPMKAFALAFLFFVVNPKNVLLCMAAGVVIGDAGLGIRQEVVAVVVFVVMAASTVLAPVVGYALAKERVRNPLNELKLWLQQNNATMMAVLVLVIGVALIGKGIGGVS